jgi:hypothetical protein
MPGNAQTFVWETKEDFNLKPKFLTETPSKRKKCPKREQNPLNGLFDVVDTNLDSGRQTDEKSLFNDKKL